MSLKILVTGAAGFIGSHTVQKMLVRGHQVIGLDNLNDYYAPARKQSNLGEIQASPRAQRFTFLTGDIRDRELVDSLVCQHRPEVIVNLAAMAGVRVSVEDPHLYLDVNLGGTLNLLMACQKYQVGNFILASTSSVYGATEVFPFVESDHCDRPLAPYAASKRAAEMMAFTYHHLFGVNSTVLRFFTVYGPRNRPDMLAYKVLDNIFFGTPLQLFEGGEMWRDWTFIDDITEGVCNAAERPLGYEIINLGRGEMVKLADFVSTLERLAGRPVRATHAPKADTDIDRSFAEISKAQRLLDYNPKVSAPEGAEHLWRWYQAAVLGGVGRSE
jgi:UDP-glucuronate 4-epimerase